MRPFSPLKFALLALVVAALFCCLGATFGVTTAVVVYLGVNALCAPRASVKLGVSAYTQIGDLWVPAIWKNGMTEAVVNTPNLINSPVCVTSPEINEIASGPGVEANIPFIIEPNPSDQVQKERIAPDITKLGSGLQKCVVLNRVSPLGSTAFAKQLSGVDPIAAITAMMGGIRLRQRQTALLAQLSGLYGFAGTPNQAVGAFRAVRSDNFSETLNTTPANFVDSDMLLDGTALMGRAIEKLVGGTILMHTTIATALNKQNQIDVIRNSEGEIVLRQWKGLTVRIDDSLVRAGATSGFVYFTLICAPGSIATGEKPQVYTTAPGDIAAVQLDLTQISTNDVVIYDRTRYILHPQGAKWVGTPAATDGGPTNTELAVTTNWALALNDIKNTGIVCVRTNG